jgi:hypothetical protein
MLTSKQTMFLFNKLRLYEHNPDLSQDNEDHLVQINDIFLILNNNIEIFENIYFATDGFKFYFDIFQKIKMIETLDELKTVTKYFMVDNIQSIHMQNPFNAIQSIMKICIHQLWYLTWKLSSDDLDDLYNLEKGQTAFATLHTDLLKIAIDNM